MLTFPTISYDWGETIFTLYIVKLFQKYVFFFFLSRVNLQNTTGQNSEKPESYLFLLESNWKFRKVGDEQHNSIKNTSEWWHLCQILWVYTVPHVSNMTFPKGILHFFQTKGAILGPLLLWQPGGSPEWSMKLADVTNRIFILLL